jgi:hypothetical protein
MRRRGLLCLTTLAVAGCGGGSSHTSSQATKNGSNTSQRQTTNNGTTTSQSQTTKQITLASVCASHQKDVGQIAAGLLAFKISMTSGDMASLSAIAGQVTSAVSDLRHAAVGVTSSSPAATRKFLEYLQSLSESFQHPPKYPTASIGNSDVQLIERAATAAGCAGIGA